MRHEPEYLARFFGLPARTRILVVAEIHGGGITTAIEVQDARSETGYLRNAITTKPASSYDFDAALAELAKWWGECDRELGATPGNHRAITIG